MNSSFRFVFVFISFLILFLVRVYALPPSTTNVLLLCDIHFDPLSDKSIVKDLLDADVSEWPTILASADSFKKDLYPSLGHDTNYRLLTSVLSEITSKEPFDFVVICGDYLRHNFAGEFEKIGISPKDFSMFASKTAMFVVQTIQNSVKVPAYFALGNDDSPCNDYGTDIGGPFLGDIASSLQVLSGHPEAAATFEEGGFYELPHPIMTDEQIVVLNSVLWSPLSFSCRSGPRDPGEEEMLWLSSKLQEAKASFHKLILVMHIPPGIDAFSSARAGSGHSPTLFWRETYLKEFQALMHTFGDLVKIVLAGHTHMDEFRVLSDSDRSHAVAFRITPAISPIYRNNPAFSVLTYDRGTGDVTDIDTYYLDICNGIGQRQWKHEYNFADTYGCGVFNARNLLTLAERIIDEPDVRSVFARYYSVLAPLQIDSQNWPVYCGAQTTFTAEDFIKKIASMQNR
jgi:sphingomyelin phosphodiesterase acid-like 3